MINSIDIGILIVLLASGLIGVARGMTREILGLLCWALATVVSYYGYPYLKPHLASHIHTPILLDGVSMAIVFVVALIVFMLLSRSVSTTIRGSALSGLDRSLGLLFGIFRGGILVCVGYLGLAFFIKPGAEPPLLKGSRAMPYVAHGSNLIKVCFPETFNQKLHDPLGVHPGIKTHAHDAILKLAQPPILHAPEAGSVSAPTVEDLDRLLATHGGGE